MKIQIHSMTIKHKEPARIEPAIDAAAGSSQWRVPFWVEMGISSGGMAGGSTTEPTAVVLEIDGAVADPLDAASKRADGIAARAQSLVDGMEPTAALAAFPHVLKDAIEWSGGHDDQV